MFKHQTIFRAPKNRENPYTKVSNSYLRNKNVTFCAKGILTYILSMPDTWNVNVSDLIASSGEGRSIVYREVKELVCHGYMQQICHRENGKISRYEYLIYEQPVAHQQEPLTYHSTTETPFQQIKTDTKHDPLLPRNQETASREAEIVHTPLLPKNLHAENQQQVSNDLNNKILKNKTSSSSARCVIFDLWEEIFCNVLQDWEYTALVKSATRTGLVRNICLIQEHHNVSDIQSPFAFVYSCVTNGGYSIPEKGTQPRSRYEEKKKGGRPLPKAVQRQQESPSAPKYTEEELAEKRERIEGKLRVMEERKLRKARYSESAAIPGSMH